MKVVNANKFVILEQFINKIKCKNQKMKYFFDNLFKWKYLQFFQKFWRKMLLIFYYFYQKNKRIFYF